jgi:hypothetical protein
LEDAEGTKLAIGDFGQSHGRVRLILEEDGLPLEPAVIGESLFHAGEQIRANEDGIAAAKADRIAARYGQRRVAVQRGRKRL